MSDRINPPSEGEGFPTVTGNQSYVGAVVGPSEHWADLTGDGKKQPTGRIRIMNYEMNRSTNQPFKFDNPERFAAWFNLIVLEGEYAGTVVGYQVNLKKLQMDLYGQRWSYTFQASTQWLNKLTRLLQKCGCEFEDGIVTPWMNEVQQHVDGLEDRDWLWMPVPTAEQMAEINLADATPYPGMTRELILMGIRAMLVKHLPILQFETRVSESGKVRIVHDSLAAIPPGAESTYRAMLETDAVKKALEAATRTLHSGITAPIANATWGMPGYEVVNDHDREPIQFDTDEQQTVKAILKAQVNQVAAALGGEFKAQAWGIIEDAFGKCGVQGRGFQDLPWHAVEATYYEIMQAARAHLATGLPAELLMTLDQFNVCVEEGLDPVSLAGYAESAPVPAPQTL
jgi:hypothetical protein